MNIGRFFRLNQSLSVVVDGVVVYNYTELPAYQGLASDNTMSPKYPISLVITSDSVRFRMHYCNYKSSAVGAPPLYGYDMESVFNNNGKNNLAHIEEVILELPFVEKPTSDLTDIIKGTYIANFPQISTDKHGRTLSKMGHILTNVGDDMQNIGDDLYVSYCNILKLNHMKEMVGNLQRMESELREKSAAFLVCARDLQQIVENLPNKDEELKNIECKDPISFLKEKSRDLDNDCGVLRKVIAYLQNPERIKQEERVALISEELPDTYNNLQENGKALHQIGSTLLSIGIDIQGSSESQMTGSRFLDLLIDEWSKGTGSKVSAVSYSTLWLMDLYKDNRFDLYDDTSEGSNQVTKFLRKLLLDFMFDLKHSSVFNTSPNYDRMYSGLMSNYYFSALMHKCEFYYYRELTIRAVEENLVKKTDDQLVLLYAKELFDAEDLWAADIRNPLADKYFEQAFPNDFKHRGWLKGQQWTEFCSNVFERMTKTRWDSWFANPEEEMRRIYFVMKENGISRICNSVVLSEHLMMDKSDDETVCAMALSARQNRGNTSRWFLNRYDFNDVLHLHFFKGANLLWFVFLLVVLSFLFEVWDISFLNSDSSKGLLGLINCAEGIRESLLKENRVLLSIVLGLLLFLDILFIKWGFLYPISEGKDALRKSFRRFRAKRIVLVFWLGVCLLLLPYNLLHTGPNPNPVLNPKLCDYNDWLYALLIIISCTFLAFILIKNSFIRIGIVAFSVLICLWLDFITVNKWTMGISVLVGLLCAAGLYMLFDSALFSKRFGKYLRPYRVFRKPYIHPIESWHLLLPKLVASITAAWLTIAMGFDALAAFFDSPVLWPTMAIIVIVVFSFILYQIDRELPESSSWLKVYRTVEMIVISYCLSLCVGVIIVNFVGERYLERSGTQDTYFDEYVFDHGEVQRMVVKTDTGVVMMNAQELTNSREKQDLLSHDYAKMHRTPGALPDSLDKKDAVIARPRIIYSTRQLFVIPDFTIMFSFVAMFIGVFLQMVFFERKKITEF